MKIITNMFEKQALDEVISNGGPFYCYGLLKLSDYYPNNLDSKGEAITLELTSDRDFAIDGNSISVSMNSSAFPIGQALCKQAKITLDNSTNRFSAYDFSDSELTLFTEFDGFPANTTYRIQEGIFYISKPDTTSGKHIELTGYDAMSKADVEVFVPNSYFGRSSSTRIILQQIANKVGIESNINLPYNIPIIYNFGKMTARQAFAYIAQLYCGNMIINSEGKLELLLINGNKEFSSTSVQLGGILTDGLTDSTQGGILKDGLSDTYSGSTIEPEDIPNYPLLSEYNNDITISSDDVAVSGIYIKKPSNVLTNVSDAVTTIRFPAIDPFEPLEANEFNKHAIDLTTPLFLNSMDDKTDITTRLKGIASNLMKEDSNSPTGYSGYGIRPFSGNFQPNPLLELCDFVLVKDLKGNIYESIITSLTFTYGGNSDISCTLENSNISNSYTSKSLELYTQAQYSLYDTKEELEKEISNVSNSTDTKISDLNNSLTAKINGLSGMYFTKVAGSGNYYQIHDKPKLANSTLVLLINDQGLDFSFNGGKTYLFHIDP